MLNNYLDEVPFTINKDGRYFLAKHKNSLAAHFSMLCRTESKDSLVPGPGQYDLAKESLSP